MFKIYAICFLFTSFSFAEPYKPAHELIKQHYGLSSTNVRIDEEEVYRQAKAFTNEVSFEIALLAALKNLFEDDSDSESPLALLNSDDDVINNAIRLHELLNQATTLFALVSPADFSDTTNVFPPEHGEKLEDFWIFYLTMPHYSDHLFWVLVSRKNATQAYNYGFN